MSGGAHPAALDSLDLIAVWQAAPALGDHFDPFSFVQRMAAYRRMLEATNRNGAFGADNAGNPLWGLMFQHQWQYRSGRLAALPPRRADDPAEQAGYRIDPDAGWGFGNYALCAIPYLGAIDAGVVEDLEILGPAEASAFAERYVRGGGPAGARIVPEAFRAALSDWTAFFAQAARLAPGEDQEALRMALWKAHKTSLDVVVAALARTTPSIASVVELQFLHGWCRMVDYLWAAAWPTDFNFMLEHGLDVLPERVLTDEDGGLALADLPRKVRQNVRNVVGLGRLSRLRHGVGLWLWRRAMVTRPARDEVREMLDAVFNPNPDNKAARRRLLRYTLGI